MFHRLIVLCTVALLGVSARAEDLAIVVDKSVALDNVSFADLAKIFRCEKTSATSGLSLTIVTRDRGSAERNAAVAGIYKLTDATYEKYFMQQVFTGALAAAPKMIPSATSMKKIVLSAPGTVGYLRASDVDATVKVVKIDGTAPGDPGYPIKLAN